jgi:hypothetical protein
MIWEDVAENKIVALLQASTSIATIRRGMYDENPNLSFPALVVSSRVLEVTAREQMYKVLVTIEYKSIPEENSVSGGSGVEAIMGTVDLALTTTPSSGVLAQIPNYGEAYFGWEGVPRTNQEIRTDRRTNIREVEAWVTMGISFTGNTHSSITVDGISSMAGITVGHPISGLGIPPNATISTVNVPGLSLTLSQSATATATGVTLATI